MAADEVVRELCKVGFANIADYIDEGMNLLPLNDVKKDKLAAVQDLKVVKKKVNGGEVKITTLKMHNKLTALDALMKHTGGYGNRADTIKSQVVFYLPDNGREAFN